MAQATETTIKKLNGYEAFSSIWKECSVNAWDVDDIERASFVVQKLVETVPVYYLACTPDVSAIEALEKQWGEI